MTNQIKSPELGQKYEDLLEFIRKYKSVAVAYSGGVDSALMAKAAADALGSEGALCLLANSETLTSKEFQDACRLAEDHGWRLAIMKYSELSIEGYAANPTNRCYFCKSELYNQIESYLTKHELAVDAVFDGTNADDMGDYRPGLAAKKEHGVVSPLVECGLTKADVRELSEELGLPTHDKPSAPCLSSRFPYGVEITPERLKMVAEGEAYLRELGFRDLRVRFHESIARIEVPAEEFSRLLEDGVREGLIARFREIGFHFVTLDLQGFRTGSLNEILLKK